MFIKSMLAEKFKNIMHVEFIADGNHVVITGENGTGKTAVMQAILTLLFGKKVLPEDPIMHGQESALLQCGISGEKGGDVMYKIRARITEKNFGIEVSTFTPGGAELTVKKPVEFLAGIVTRDFIDPDDFCRKSGKERIAMLYKLLPDLQSTVDALTAEYETEQVRRQQINIEKNRLEVELVNTPFTPDLPEAEIDPADLFGAIQEAQKHNARLPEIEELIVEIDKDIDTSNEMALSAAEEIKALEVQIAHAREKIDRCSEQVDRLAKLKSEKITEKENFKPVDEQLLQAKLSGLKVTNENIRKNTRRKELEKELAQKSAEYSDGLAKMKVIEQKKVNVYKDAKMPVEGLAVGDTDITFPDPNTGERVLFGSLSTGQKAMVSVGVLSAFLPKSEVGLRCMVINDANALDEKNYLAMLEAANANDVQLLLHKTVYKSESNKLEIVIEER